jgi:hypothetical protein
MRWTSAAFIASVAVLVLSGAPVSAVGSAGFLDPSFGTGGVVIVPTTSSGLDPMPPTAAIARAPSGRLYVLSRRSYPVPGPGANELVEVTAFTASGRIDTSFNHGRPVVWTFVGTPEVSGPFVTSSGGVEVVLMLYERTTVMRLTKTGQPDSAYSGNGVASLRAPTSYTTQSATRLPGGSTRWVEEGYPKANYLSGLTPSGAIDTRIGPGGLRKLPVEGVVFEINADASGRLYILNRRENVLDVVRTNSSGVPDPTWGSAGIVSLALTDVVWDGIVKPAPSGDVYVVAQIQPTDPSLIQRSVIIKLDPNGTPITAFGSGGFLDVPTTGGPGSVSALTLDNAGRLDVAFLKLGPTRAYLTRLSGTTGAVDTAFGQGGLVRTTGLTSGLLDTATRLVTVGRSYVNGRVRMVLAGRIN